MIRWLQSKLKRRQLLGQNEGLILGENAQVRNSKLGRFNFVAANSKVVNSQLGDYSYVARNSNVARARIGSFCSIGSEVLIAPGTHPTSMVSTHPVFYSVKFPCQRRFADQSYFEDTETIEIGHDVWIGSRAVIFDGVTIGTGAVVAAGAVVNRDVGPYEIVGGVPAKLIRQRFDDDRIQRLLESRWWERDLQWIQQHYKKFHDPASFERLLQEGDG